QRYRESLVAYRGALDLRPEAYRAHIGMAKAQMKLGREAQVLAHLKAALEIEPDTYPARQLLALFYLKRGDTRQALGEYHEMIRIRPWSAQPHFLIGRAIRRLGRHQEARQNFLRALELDANHAGARRALRLMGRKQPPGG
ncbi:MAG: tetratricopeptide repeat protein, partial [Deltaproteobacteria bacterium]|nr:tetratricopeptide repeat protein [Deltaproteobacteria bacterium]